MDLNGKAYTYCIRVTHICNKMYTESCIVYLIYVISCTMNHVLSTSYM